MGQRFFRSTDAVYESVRGQLDAAWGHGADTGTLTCVDPAAVAPHDEQGRVVLAVDERFLDYHAVAAILPDLLASGDVEEIDELTYREASPRQPQP